MNTDTDTERFITAIRQAIETAFREQGQEDHHDAPCVASGYGDGELLVDGYIDTNALARAVHAAVVEHLGPPF